MGRICFFQLDDYMKILDKYFLIPFFYAVE